MPTMPERLADAPCPRCGCYLLRHFTCGCGACDNDSCVNCGRWTDLEPGEFVELTVEAPARCTAGAVDHSHVPMYCDLSGDWRRL